MTQIKQETFFMSSTHSIILDVREKDEFDAEHIADSIHIPLAEVARKGPSLLKALSHQQVILMCRSGGRAQIAKNQLASSLSAERLKVYEGGILAWKGAGNPVISTKKTHLPLMRQVQLGSGALALLGVILSLTVHPAWIYLCGFVGAGLIVAGSTGFCGMAELLARAPWNKNEPSLKEEMCNVSPRSGGCA
jgi:rhodanese-related sulfurtransferase